MVETLRELFGHWCPSLLTYAEKLRDWQVFWRLRREGWVTSQDNRVRRFKPKNVWICGLHSPEGTNILARAMRKIKNNPETTLKELSVEIRSCLSMRNRNQCRCQQEKPLKGLSTKNRVRQHKRRFWKCDHTILFDCVTAVELEHRVIAAVNVEDSVEPKDYRAIFMPPREPFVSQQPQIWLLAQDCTRNPPL